MNENDLYKDVSRRLIELMKQTFQSRFNWYYLGAPSMLPPEDALPCLIVHSPHAKIGLDATGTDSFDEVILINIITNQKDDFNSPDNEFQDTTLRKLQNLIQGRDPSTGQWLPGTVIEALRTNFTLDDAALRSEISIDYDVTPRPDLPSIVEAVITIDAGSLVQVPSRT